MKLLKYNLAALLLVTTLLSLSQVVVAHPGNTASDGAHYCWTNCEAWGEVYGQRHSHGGGYVPTPTHNEDYAPDPPERDYSEYEDYTPEPEYTPTTQKAVATPNRLDNSPSSNNESSDNSGWWILGGLLTLGIGSLLSGRKD